MEGTCDTCSHVGPVSKDGKKFSHPHGRFGGKKACTGKPTKVRKAGLGVLDVA